MKSNYFFTDYTAVVEMRKFVCMFTICQRVSTALNTLYKSYIGNGPHDGGGSG